MPEWREVPWAKAISRTGKARNVILDSHDNKLSNISRILIQVEAMDWLRKVTTDECSENGSGMCCIVEFYARIDSFEEIS